MNVCSQKEYNQTRYRCFEKTGCLITADGSNDSKIKPEGLHDYVVPKALPVQVAEDAAECVVPVAAPEPNDVLDSDVDDPFADESVSNGERKDEHTDRVYDHIMVKKKVRALYDNGWHTGNIQWYNNKLDEYRVFFPDGTDDYIKLDDADGIEMVVL